MDLSCSSTCSDCALNSIPSTKRRVYHPQDKNSLVCFVISPGIFIASPAVQETCPAHSRSHGAAFVLRTSCRQMEIIAAPPTTGNQPKSITYVLPPLLQRLHLKAPSDFMSANLADYLNHPLTAPRAHRSQGEQHFCQLVVASKGLSCLKACRFMHGVLGLETACN